MGTVSDRLDRGQRQFPPLSIPIAVVYKYFDDQGNYLAAILTYYAFIAIFPLLLLASSILGFVLQGRPELQQEVLSSTLSQFPIIGDQLGRPEGLQGSTAGVVVGALAALYGALGLGTAIQNAMNVAWSVPRNSRPNPILLRLKSLLLLVTAGAAVVTVTVLSTLVSRTSVIDGSLNVWLSWLVQILTVVVIGLILTLLFRVAAARRHSWRSAAPGAFTLAVLWQLLQYLGAWYVTHVLGETSSMNKTFALVLGLIGLLYVGAVMGMLGIEVNVVLARRLWPRALLTPFTDSVDLTEADRRAYTFYARAQRHKGFENVEVTFDDLPVIEAPVNTDSAEQPGPEPR
ncbi:YihY/virulence factor BrkB family protein [Nocardioides ungokensis]|uniref:YihY/virulence factor BrkB family protein n=1 Tax=Nocardioides ungokensis TaxID=1643322 RepID=UPI0015E04C73|nr:YihY/virulence factor BrkB family protein [Nocardioides ungokensis]